jgi:hypothetical protein
LPGRRQSLASEADKAPDTEPWFIRETKFEFYFTVFDNDAENFGTNFLKNNNFTAI